MQCADLIRYLSDYIDNQLSEELAAEAREHLATCRDCCVVLDSTQQTILLYREHGRQQVIPAERQQALFGQLAAALAARPDDCDPCTNP